MRIRYGFIFMLTLGFALIGRSKNVGDYFPAGAQRELAEAAAAGRIADVDRILSQGGKIDYQGADGMTALAWALLYHNKNGFQHLLQKGANPNLVMPRSTITPDHVLDGKSVMSLATMDDDAWFLDVTLMHSGDPNIVNPITGDTPIFNNIDFLDRRKPDRLKQLDMLIKAGADLNHVNREGYTPIMKAAIANRYDMVYRMLIAGADPTISTKFGTTIVTLIKRIRTDPKSDLYQWRSKVVELLKSKGME